MTRVLRAAALLAPLLVFTACHQAGPAERAGRSLDNAAAETRDTIDPPANPVERAGRQLDRAVEPGPGQRTGRTLDQSTR
jgi:hypothetical protein